MRTSLDLELDLQASKNKLEVMNEEITRLHKLKHILEGARERGEETPSWLSENEQWQNLLADAATSQVPKTDAEKRAAKMLRKRTREITKLRQSARNEPDPQLFREKMAFFTMANPTVPAVPSTESDEDNEGDIIIERL